MSESSAKAKKSTLAGNRRCRTSFVVEPVEGRAVRLGEEEIKTRW